MHLQIRTAPRLSPPNLEAMLGVLKAGGFNIEAVGGSDVERGGEFAFAVAHGQENRAMAALRKAGYKPRKVVVPTCALTNEPGQLFSCIAGIAADNAKKGLVIKDIAIGVPDAEGRIQVQVYSEAP
jgi:hypothetical protein